MRWAFVANMHSPGEGWGHAVQHFDRSLVILPDILKQTYRNDDRNTLQLGVLKPERFFQDVLYLVGRERPGYLHVCAKILLTFHNDFLRGAFRCGSCHGQDNC